MNENNESYLFSSMYGSIFLLWWNLFSLIAFSNNSFEVTEWKFLQDLVIFVVCCVYNRRKWIKIARKIEITYSWLPEHFKRDITPLFHMSQLRFFWLELQRFFRNFFFFFKFSHYFGSHSRWSRFHSSLFESLLLSHYYLYVSRKLCCGNTRRVVIRGENAMSAREFLAEFEDFCLCDSQMQRYDK